MPNVTVLAATGSGAVQPQLVPFYSSVAATIAQKAIAQAISAGVSSGSVYAAPPGTQPGLPNQVNVGEFKITSGTPGSSFQLTPNYTDVVNTATTPVTITGGGGSQPYEILAGRAGTTFFAQDSLGGAIALGGGDNTIAGSPRSAIPGLVNLTPVQGNWLIDVSPGESRKTNVVDLGAGQDTVYAGGAFSVSGGGGGTLVENLNTTATKSTVILGSGAETVLGQAGGHMLVGPASPNFNISGADFLEGGALGHDTITAPVASGINTLVGGGPGDELFTAPGNNSAVFFAGTGAETLDGSASSGPVTLFGGTSSANGSPDDLMSLGSGNGGLVVAGSGNDTIQMGAGQSSVWFIQTNTSPSPGSASPSTDILMDFNTNKDSFVYQFYGNEQTSFTVSTVQGGAYSGDVMYTMSDGTKVIFNNVKDSDLIHNVKI